MLVSCSYFSAGRCNAVVAAARSRVRCICCCRMRARLCLCPSACKRIHLHGVRCLLRLLPLLRLLCLLPLLSLLPPLRLLTWQLELELRHCLHRCRHATSCIKTV